MRVRWYSVEGHTRCRAQRAQPQNTRRGEGKAQRMVEVALLAVATRDRPGCGRAEAVTCVRYCAAVRLMNSIG